MIINSVYNEFSGSFAGTSPVLHSSDIDKTFVSKTKTKANTETLPWVTRPIDYQDKDLDFQDQDHDRDLTDQDQDRDLDDQDQDQCRDLDFQDHDLRFTYM